MMQEIRFSSLKNRIKFLKGEMRTVRKILSLVIMMLAMVLSEPGNAGAINVDVYSGSTLSGGGTPYSGFVGSFTSPDILFATNTGYNWHPFSLTDFGADITGFLNVSSPAFYSFTLNSDDGSRLFIDGSLVIDNGGAHPPAFAFATPSLTAGIHPFEVQFFECCGGASGVDLYLPDGVTYAAPVPEPSSLLLLGSGLIGLGLWGRKRILNGQK